jgi:thioredoxin 1
MNKNIVELNDNNFEEILKSDKPVVVDFWAEWCNPCRMISPIIDDLANEFEGKIIVAKCDIDANIKVAQAFTIRNIPTILFFKNGVIVDKQVGATGKNVFQNKINVILQ